MRSSLLCAALVIVLAAVCPQPAQADLTLGHLTNWVGIGSNSAGLLIDWNDGKQPEWQAWGYRWEGGAPTVLDMLKSIAGSWRTVDWIDADIEINSGSGGADARFAVVFRKHFSWGHAVDSFAYDLDNNGVALDGTDSGDNYAAGFEIGSNGYWSFYVRPDSGGPWGYAIDGPGATFLTNGDWYGFSWARDFVDTAPVPEPATLALLAVGGVGLAWRRRRTL